MEFRLPLNSLPAASALSGFVAVGELLDNRFSLLWRGRRTALPRHQTLNAMLDWSYNLLSQHEQAVLVPTLGIRRGFHASTPPAPLQPTRR